MKEKEIWLSPDELQRMLQGSMLWNDVASRTAGSKTGIRKLGEPFSNRVPPPVDRQEEDKNLHHDKKQAEANKEPDRHHINDHPVAEYITTHGKTERSPRSEEIVPEIEQESTVKLEGQPVVWLLGSVGFLTLFSWFYFVLFAN